MFITLEMCSENSAGKVKNMSERLSVISNEARIGRNVKIYDFVNIYGSVTIGDESRIGAFVELQPGVVIGRRVKVSSHTFVCTGVTILDEAFIGHGVMFTNDKFPRSVNNDGVLINAAEAMMVPTIIGRGASIGSGSTILCGITVGEGALVGAGSVVTRDVPPGAVVCGNPARIMKSQIRDRTIKIESQRPSTMIADDRLIQTHNQVLLDQYRTKGPSRFGPYTSETWRRDPKHVFFTMARYKFCAKMLAGKSRVLEVGCGDAVGSPILLQTVDKLHGIDLEQIIIDDNIVRNETPDRLTFEVLDITSDSPQGHFDAAISMDVIEHISENKDHMFMQNICAVLNPQALCIIGTPNIYASQYASPNSIDGHINLKSHEKLKSLMEQYFENVLLFSMNDEIIHTGYNKMGHYIMAIGAGVMGA